MKNSKTLSTESNAETLRLHSLIQKRSKVALQAVEEMSKHPFSPEQAKQQAAKMKLRAKLK